ncbi:cell wall-binding repeat-containing protein [Clostridium paridis]|uniref:Cell wall-binding repeat-containing protein n=1 Tax=Clostridium paridis TaxID=2803863 RepID=A0A937FHT0_9CLOT|nr:cell wall-binding repeat-containing protein [Clostridium paridis]MBL4933634.1 cell wall-binding repeat-containing protein [Clostridium paridis]
MSKRKILRILLGLALVSSILVSNSLIKVQAQTLANKRLEGKDRYETAISISNEVIKDSTVNNVILATGSDFPDALTGSVLAAKLKAPILLTGDDSNNAKDLDFINKNLPKSGNIYVLGSSGVIPDKLINQIKANGYNNITRLGGNNREETARIINQNLNVPKGTTVVVVTGLDFPDALSISSVAGVYQYPIVLSYKDSLPSASIQTLKDIQPSNVYIIGSEGVVSNNVVNQVKSATPSVGSNVFRFGGKDRFETSTLIAKSFGLNSTNLLIATGFDFPDALSGSVLASKLRAPILLVNSNDTTTTKNYLDNDATHITGLIFLGSYGAVSQAAEKELINADSTGPIYQPVIGKPSLEYMNSISVTADNSIIDGGMINEHKLPYDGKYYHIHRETRLPEGSPYGEWYIEDYYMKVLREVVGTDGKIRRYINIICIDSFGQFNDVGYIYMN